MIRRCTRPSRHDYAYYGGRGVVVCYRWRNFQAFVDDMAQDYAPGLTLDRKENNGPYSADNCRWADRKVQARNRRSTHYVTNPTTGEQLSITEWAERFSLSRNTITSRLRLGYADFRLLMAIRLPRWNANDQHVVFAEEARQVRD